MNIPKAKGLFRRALDSYIAQREREARNIIKRRLMSMDDQTLAAYGYNRSDLIRESGTWNGR